MAVHYYGHIKLYHNGCELTTIVNTVTKTAVKRLIINGRNNYCVQFSIDYADTMGHHGWILIDSKMKIVSSFSLCGAPELDSN